VVGKESASTVPAREPRVWSASTATTGDSQELARSAMTATSHRDGCSADKGFAAGILRC
jgi:hypothetical protein